MAKLKLYLYITLSTILTCTSCNSQQKKVKTINNSMYWNTTKLISETGASSFDYKFKQYFLLDSLNGFIIGNNQGAIVHKRAVQQLDNKPKIDLYENIETVIFKTTDGGNSFDKTTLGKGSLEKIVSDQQNNLYIIKQTLDPTSQTSKYNILKSTDLGKTWSEFKGAKSGVIKNVQFFNEKKGIVVVYVNKRPVVLKTTDGGETWYQLEINTSKVDPVNMMFLDENKLYSYYRSDKNFNKTITVNFETGDTIIHDCKIPNNHSFSSFFRDPKTNTLYSRVYKHRITSDLMIYDHSKQKLNTYNFSSDAKENILGISISNNYIGVLRNDNGKTFYYYSVDNGDNWTKEKLPDYLADGAPVALYGKGLVWVKSIQNLYNLQVRNSL